uniref:hypothetical protein n=1 Tax=Brevibacterium epidermidis TaxID=1698 RepID=UPI001A7E19F8
FTWNIVELGMFCPAIPARNLIEDADDKSSVFWASGIEDVAWLISRRRREVVPVGKGLVTSEDGSCS